MLTQDDLHQIAEVIDQRLDLKLEPIKKELKKQRKDITSIKTTLDVAIDHFDKRDIKVNKQLDIIKTHLGLTSS